MAQRGTARAASRDGRNALLLKHQSAACGLASGQRWDHRRDVEELCGFPKARTLVTRRPQMVGRPGHPVGKCARSAIRGATSVVCHR